jgi:hypothetical protein
MPRLDQGIFNERQACLIGISDTVVSLWRYRKAHMVE